MRVGGLSTRSAVACQKDPRDRAVEEQQLKEERARCKVEEKKKRQEAAAARKEAAEAKRQQKEKERLEKRAREIARANSLLSQARLEEGSINAEEPRGTISAAEEPRGAINAEGSNAESQQDLETGS